MQNLFAVSITNPILKIIIAILYGILEGITEWLPISSTGHMILLDQIFSVKDMFIKEDNPLYSAAFWDMFLVVIQLGAIMAVVIYFFNKLWPFSNSKTKEEKIDTWKIWLKTLIACIPAAVIGLLFDDFIEEHLNNMLTVSITLIIYGILFIVIEIWNKKRTLSIDSIKKMSYKTVFIIGCMQLLALIPGTSRSGVTILGAMLLGCNRESSAEFSFFLSIPVMVGASLLKSVKFIADFGLPSGDELLFLSVGMLVAFGISLIAVKWLMSFVKKHDFKIFGIYRIILGGIVLIIAITNLLA